MDSTTQDGSQTSINTMALMSGEEKHKRKKSTETMFYSTISIGIASKGASKG